jgi:hypothetical protein
MEASVSALQQDLTKGIKRALLSRCRTVGHCAHRRGIRWVRPFAGYCLFLQVLLDIVESHETTGSPSCFFLEKGRLHAGFTWRPSYCQGYLGRGIQLRIIDGSMPRSPLIARPTAGKRVRSQPRKKYWWNFTKISSLLVRYDIFYLNKIPSLSTPSQCKLLYLHIQPW